MWEDPIVAEVHRIREKLLDESGGTLKGLLHGMRERRDGGDYADREFIHLPSRSPRDYPRALRVDVSQGMHRDPIVEEIHRIRQELLDEFGGDMDALAEDTNRRLFNGEYGDVKIVRYPPKPPVHTPKRDVG